MTIGSESETVVSERTILPGHCVVAPEILQILQPSTLRFENAVSGTELANASSRQTQWYVDRSFSGALIPVNEGSRRDVPMLEYEIDFFEETESPNNLPQALEGQTPQLLYLSASFCVQLCFNVDTRHT